MHSPASSWQALCKRAAVERDPVRLLALFLWIDLLGTHKTEKHRNRPEQVVQPQFSRSSCPHCSAIIEPEEQLSSHLEKCPWCEGSFKELENYLHS